MAAIDGLLKLVRQQGADELRLAVGQAPKMFARGEPKRLSVPATAESTLRTLLSGILTPDCEAALAERGTAETRHDAGALGAYRVVFRAAGRAFEVIFTLAGEGQAHPAASATPPRAAPEPAPSSPAHPRAPVEAEQLGAWIRRAVSMRASDLHLAEGECPCLRVDGILEQLDNAIVGDLSAVFPLQPEQWRRLERGESIDLALEVAGAGRVRAHLYATESGTAAALRLLPRAAPMFSTLNMPMSFDDLVELPHGLVLVCGPAGAGKSTTLAALAQDALRRRSIVLVSLEDPIEYTLIASATSLVRRRQIGRDARDFAGGLRDALRADPDVILIGELRDRETIALALTAAETGQLVLASIHSRSTASAIERIVDAFSGDQQGQVRVQLSEALRVVVAQRLLPRKHGEGRLPAIEVLRVNRAVASLIRDAKTAQLASVLQSSKQDGMLALERCLADRVQAGEIHVEDAMAAANSVEVLAQFLGR